MWHAGHATILHAVTFRPDSVRGVPYLQSPDCDSCAVALPRAEVDSVRVGDTVSGFWQSVLLGAAFFLGVYIYICYQNNFCGWFD